MLSLYESPAFLKLLCLFVPSAAQLVVSLNVLKGFFRNASCHKNNKHTSDLAVKETRQTCKCQVTSQPGFGWLVFKNTKTKSCGIIATSINIFHFKSSLLTSIRSTKVQHAGAVCCCASVVVFVCHKDRNSRCFILML